MPKQYFFVKNYDKCYIFNFKNLTNDKKNMTITNFPVTGAIGNDADIIINALNSRAEQIKSNTESQSILKKITIVASQIIGLAAGIVTVACLPASLFLFSVTPLTIAAISLVSCISFLALHILLDPRSPGELIVKDHWKHVFEALKEGDGKKIIQTCQDLFKQKDQRITSFKLCLGTLPPDDVDPFFHKTSLVGYLQLALEHLRNNEDDMAKSKAHLALSHFESSGFAPKVKLFATAITENPQEMKHYIESKEVGYDLHALDYLLSHY